MDSDYDFRVPEPVPFDYNARTRVIFGTGSVERVGDLAEELGAKRVLLVTDRGIVKAGHAEHVETFLTQAKLHVTRFDGVEENPSTQCVEKCVTIAREAAIDTIVGLGGGSSMDTAKGCNFILTNGGRMQDYWGIGRAKRPMLPLIAIPTTGGTGSECQSFALITDEQTHQKMACGDPKAAARIAVLDPALTLSQPPRVTACSGIDAIAHSVETAVTKKRNPMSLVFSREAFRLTMAGLPRVLASPNDVEARGWMLLGAAWGGTAIENSMLGAAHSAANPLTARFGIVHGHAVGLMLPHVVRFNASDPPTARRYAELAFAAHLANPSEAVESAVGRLAECLESLLPRTNLPASLKDCGVQEKDIPQLASEAATQWTAQFNPCVVNPADFETIFCAALRA
jgi:alcohol dehydrogenase